MEIINTNRIATDIGLMDSIKRSYMATWSRADLEDVVWPLIEKSVAKGHFRTENAFEAAIAGELKGEVVQCMGGDVRTICGLLVEAKTLTGTLQTGAKQSKFAAQRATVKFTGAKEMSDLFLFSVTSKDKVKSDRTGVHETRTVFFLVPKYAAYTTTGKFRKSFDFKINWDGTSSVRCPNHKFHFTDFDSLTARVAATPLYTKVDIESSLEESSELFSFGENPRPPIY